MMRTKKDKTTLTIILLALCFVGVAAFAGIALTLHREKPEEIAAEEIPANEEDVQLSIAEKNDTEAPPEKNDVKIDVSIDAKVSGDAAYTQSIQETPEKSENERPVEPPASVQEQEASNPSRQPENSVIPDDKPEPTPAPSNTPQNGQVNGGKIYIEGFGWIDYNGGGTEGVFVDGMRENGNKVGSMD